MNPGQAQKELLEHSKLDNSFEHSTIKKIEYMHAKNITSLQQYKLVK